MRRYVTIGGIVVATVLVGSAAAYAGPDVLVPRAASKVSADGPDPSGTPTPALMSAPGSSAAVPCPAPSAAGQPADPAVAPAVTQAPTTEPAPPAPPAGTGGAFQAAPATAIPDVPAAAGGAEGSASAEHSRHDEPGDEDGDEHGGGHGDGQGRDTTAVPPAPTPTPATPAPATPAPATPAPATPAPVTPAPAAPGECTAPTGTAPTGTAPTGTAPTGTGTAAGSDTSAATKYGWGTPNRVDNFDGALGPGWSVYDGPGHNGAGRRTPDSITFADGVMTMTGDPQGNSGGMAWEPGQRYGRWEARVRSLAGDPDYHAVLLLWPDAENWPLGGEIDFMEISDPTRHTTQMFLHYGQDNQQVQGSVDIDATRWHDWAVEWAPSGVTAYVDGKVWWSTEDTSILPPGPMHLCIQLDNFGGTGLAKTSMEVDWVKQYGLNAGDVLGTAAEGVADAAGSAVRPLVEGAPDPVPAVAGLVSNAVAAPRG